MIDFYRKELTEFERMRAYLCRRSELGVLSAPSATDPETVAVSYADYAELVLREKLIMRSKEIAAELVNNHGIPDKGGRSLEGALYTAAVRREDQFSNISNGLWTLKEFWFPVPESDAKIEVENEKTEQFIGRWQLLENSSEKEFFITLKHGFLAEKCWQGQPKVNGTWSLVGDEVQIKWEDEGWYDRIRPHRNGQFIKIAYSPGSKLEELPSNLQWAKKTQ